MLNALDISTSGLVAQRTRMNAISANIANMSTTRNANGEIEPYAAKYVVFETDDNIQTSGGGTGVRVASVNRSTKAPNMKHEPGHRDADENDMVAYPNIDMTTQFVDALEATRAYEANIGVIDITKDLARQTLRILA